MTSTILRSLVNPFLALLTIIKNTKGPLNLLVMALVIVIVSSFGALAAYLNVARDQDKLISSYHLVGEPEKWKAVIQDLDESGKPKISTETLTLFYSGKFVVGWAEDDAEKNDEGKPYRWRLSGYKAAGQLVLSYLTDKPDPHGIGTYTFREYGKDYVGHWMGVPWVGAEIVRCPGLLIKGTVDLDKVQREWPSFKQHCVAASS